MSGSLSRFLCVSIVPCHYGQVSGVTVWLAKKLSGIKILKETERKRIIGVSITRFIAIPYYIDYLVNDTMISDITK